MLPGLLHGPTLELHPSEEEVLHFLLPLSADYPGIENWFRRKVVPGLRVQERYIHRVERDGHLIGVGIAKNGPTEKKICTVRVLPEHFGRGAGVRIFDHLLRWLDDDRPHLTVSEGKLPAFERIFDHYGFSETSQRNGLYVPGRFEFGFNENATAVNEGDARQPPSGQAGE
ncbi:GNAT family N-acetyltransferase [Neorhizobium galegae]|uniref:GNAT family N-acetyltransferase n=1 Tax=Neorhizobium galegae TaxID=399 RepID=UPI00210780C9|nr:GNAT family N-acetyltransferase [Neorhizobium galegae]MCQ1855374.1 GNAT family N-acetyltransferase [Neorhizobium galegae]